jgi:hypothetical protein
MGKTKRNRNEGTSGMCVNMNKISKIMSNEKISSKGIHTYNSIHLKLKSRKN